MVWIYIYTFLSESFDNCDRNNFLIQHHQKSVYVYEKLTVLMIKQILFSELDKLARLPDK